MRNAQLGNVPLLHNIESSFHGTVAVSGRNVLKYFVLLALNVLRHSSVGSYDLGNSLHWALSASSGTFWSAFNPGGRQVANPVKRRRRRPRRCKSHLFVRRLFTGVHVLVNGSTSGELSSRNTHAYHGYRLQLASDVLHSMYQLGYPEPAQTTPNPPTGGGARGVKGAYHGVKGP